MTNTVPTLVLIDGSSYLYRAYHAMPDLRAVPGDPNSPATGAIRGMINMMQSLQKAYPAPLMACVFDTSGPTFRDEWYPDYKANRSPMPDDLRSQIDPIHQVVRLMGIPVLAVPGVEADDVIGTLAKAAAAQGLSVIVSSGDKDLSQLVDAHITIIDTMNGKVRDVAGVTEEFGVPPSLMIDYQTLVGDSVDNVPGVPKVGPKTAAKWLLEHGSLAGLLAAADSIKGVAGQNLREAVDWLPMGQRLVTIKTDCDLSGHVTGLPALDALKVTPRDDAALLAFYDTYGFKGLAKTTREQAGSPFVPPLPAMGDLFEPAPAADVNTHYEVVTDWAAFDAMLSALRGAELVAFDTETDSLDEMRAKVVGLSFCTEVGRAWYVPLAHTGPDAPEQLPLPEVLAKLTPWLQDASRAKLGQHVKYDQHVLANHGIVVRGYRHDTMLQSYVLEVHKPHGLASLAQRHLGRQGLDYEDLCGKGAHQIPFAQVAVDKAAQYSCEDSDFCLGVHLRLWPLIEAEEGLSRIYALEMASSEALFRIERNGVLIDAPTLAAQSQRLGQRIVELEQDAYAIAGQPFNLSSPKQLGEIFFDKLGLPVVKKTATGARSTDEEVLEKLAEDYPLPAKILEHRSLAKLKGTYTDKLAGMALPSTGRVHTHYAQAVAVTGRLSSNDPNLQNIPVRTAEGRRVREAFVAPAGHVIASADYSQIELRIMAHLSGDAALLEAFAQGRDVHTATAAEVMGIPVEAVSPEQRRQAKAVNFGLIYGMGAFGLGKALGIDTKAAQGYIDRYFARFVGVRQYMDATKRQAKQQGYVETVFGRRLVLPEINSPNGPRRAGAERAAINAPMQGTAADLIKLAMVAVQRALDEQGKRSRIVMQVHDELVFEVPDDEVTWLRDAVPALMAQVASLKVPLVAEVGVGPNWERAH